MFTNIFQFIKFSENEHIMLSMCVFDQLSYMHYFIGLLCERVNGNSLIPLEFALIRL